MDAQISNYFKKLSEYLLYKYKVDIFKYEVYRQNTYDEPKLYTIGEVKMENDYNNYKDYGWKCNLCKTDNGDSAHVRVPWGYVTFYKNDIHYHMNISLMHELINHIDHVKDDTKKCIVEFFDVISPINYIDIVASIKNLQCMIL